MSKIRIITAVLLVVFALSFSACGNNGDAGESTAQTTVGQSADKATQTPSVPASTDSDKSDGKESAPNSEQRENVSFSSSAGTNSGANNSDNDSAEAKDGGASSAENGAGDSEIREDSQSGAVSKTDNDNSRKATQPGSTGGAGEPDQTGPGIIDNAEIDIGDL